GVVSPGFPSFLSCPPCHGFPQKETDQTKKSSIYMFTSLLYYPRTHMGIMGSRALSHDSIFIPEPVQEPARPVRVFSQENVSDRIRALQLKLQHSMKLGPPPPFGIHAKRIDDAGTSSEDDGLPRSPPEISLLHEILSSSTAARVSQLFPRHASAKTLSPRTSDSSISPAADFDTPPEFSTCLDNSAAKHKLLIKPRNQRSSKMRRLPSVIVKINRELRTEKNIQKDGQIPMETSCNKETKESAALPASSKQLPEGSSQFTDSPCVSSDIPQPALSSQLKSSDSWSLEQTMPTQELAASDKENNQSLGQREAIWGKKTEKVANELSTLRKFSVSSARERPRAGSLHLKENSECESPLNAKLPLSKTEVASRNEKLKEDVQVGSDLQEEKNSIKKQMSLANFDSEVTGKAAVKMVAGCVSQAIDAIPVVSQCQPGSEDKSPFQVKLRSTSLSLKYRDSSSPESKGFKRYSAEINLEKEGLESLLKGEKAQIKKTADVNNNGSVNDNIKSKTKSSEQLSTKPPLPRKPVFQNVTNANGNVEKQEVTKSPDSRSKDRDLEKKSCPSKVPADSAGGTDSQSKPAWITIARQKQRDMQQEPDPTKEKLVAQDVKSDTEKQNKEKERMEKQVRSIYEHQANIMYIFFFTIAQSSVLIEKEEMNQFKRVSHSVPDQPSWMELAKKKSQAWSDMPQIIK
uniref:CRACD like n=1 Tax=Gopherus evgoodei TaxID=1825980 RepID=A0A8C4VCG9_9SAUR